MNRKLVLLAELSNRTLNSVTRTKETWRNFLRFSAQLYKYSFSDTILIYAQNPRATACAEYAEWNRFGRYINSGATGIALIVENLSRPQIRYVFDVMQTNSQTIEPPKPWNLSERQLPEIIKAIKLGYGGAADRGDYKDIKSAVEDYTRSEAIRYLDGISREIPNSLLDGLDLDTIQKFFVETVVDSVGYTVSHRCGLPQGLYDDDHLSFLHLREFDSPALITRIGTAANNLSESVLRSIERTIRDLNRKADLEQRRIQYEQQENKRDEHSGIAERTGDPNRGNPEPAADKGRNAGNRQVRPIGNGAHEDGKPLQAESIDYGGTASGTVRAGGRGSEPADGVNYGTAHGERPAAQNGRIPGNGAVQQPDSRHSGGNRTDGDRLQSEINTGSQTEGAEQSVPSVASEDIYTAPDGRQFQLGFGLLGNGITVWNRLEEVDHDYKTVAHIDNDGTIQYYDSDLPGPIQELIQRHANSHKAEIENQWFDTFSPIMVKGALRDTAFQHDCQIYAQELARTNMTACLDRLVRLHSERYPDFYRHYMGNPDFRQRMEDYVLAETYPVLSKQEMEKAPKQTFDIGKPTSEQLSFEGLLDHQTTEEALKTEEKPVVSFGDEYAPVDYRTFQAQYPGAVIAYQEGRTYRFYGQSALDVRHLLERKIERHSQPDGGELFITGYPVDREEEMCHLLAESGLQAVVVAALSPDTHRVKEEINTPAEAPQEAHEAAYQETISVSAEAMQGPLKMPAEGIRNELETLPVMSIEAAQEYNRIKEQYPDYLLVFQVGRYCLLYGQDASQEVADILRVKRITAEIEGMGELPVTGFLAQNKHKINDIWSTGRNVVLATQEIPDAPHKIVMVRTAKNYLPIGARLTIDQREFTVESVNFKTDSVNLRDETSFQFGFPIFRSEHIEFIHSYWEEQFNRPENAGLGLEDFTPPVPEAEWQAMSGDKRAYQMLYNEHPTATPIPLSEWVAMDENERMRLELAITIKEGEKTERHNFKITDKDEIGAGGAKTKCRQNIEAIRLLKQIEEENRLATPDEQKILAKYAGWGGIPQVFDRDPRPEWKAEHDELQEILTSEEYRSASGSTLNAHYTSTGVIDAIYEAVRWMGFTGGNILEPAMGVGNFFGRLPDALQSSKLYGVELDSITGQIAKQLYQESEIRVTGFENTDYPDNFFDLSVGNVPFGSYGVSDPKFERYHFLIHDYFFARALDKVRPGGIVAFITSKGTMDKENTYVRQYLAERATLLGAIRLPDTAFKANAGTEVTTDILFLQKKSENIITEEENRWFGLRKLPGSDIFVNEYYAEHPDMMLGTMAYDKSMYGNDRETALHDDGRDLISALKEAIQKLPFGVMTEWQSDQEINADGTLPADPNVRNYCYAVVDEKIYQRMDSRMVPQDITGITAERVKGLISIRDQARRLIEIQMRDCTDGELKEAQDGLSGLYDWFVRQFGHINDRANRLAFRDDSDYPMLCALEIEDEDGRMKKADIFSSRTIRTKTEIKSCDTSQEALSISLNEKGRLDLAYMSSLTGKPIEEITENLRGIIFKNPLSELDDEFSGWETADEYLSGNVRRKLEVARIAAGKDSRYSINVEMLEKAQPEWLEADKIDVHLGATWVDTDDIKQFLVETLNPSKRQAAKLMVDFSPLTATWTISNKPFVAESDLSAYSVYGTSRIDGYEIADSLLNLRTVSVYDVKTVNGKEKRILNKIETITAREKATQLQTAFKRWIFDEAARRERLIKRYNGLFNSDRLRVYDGSHLTFPGMTPLRTLKKHQVDAVARILYGGNTLLAHEVGAGKTYEMIAAAMELRRLGIARKPLFVVPNHLIRQWANEFLLLYPSANILITTEKDFEKQNRKRFISRIATGDYDGVIIGHSQFEKIPVSLERRQNLLNQEIDEITDAIYEAEHDESKSRSFVKRLEGTKKRLEANLKNMTADVKKDDLLTFEQLGVDFMFVDESQNYKNLFLYTKMGNVAGIPQTAAKKSSDMYLKAQYLGELHHANQGVVFATGTPISNSMTELYTLQRYLQLSRLRELGLQMFDSWAGDFGEKVTAMELAPDGSGYRQKDRFAKFFNLPELMTLFREFADIQTAEMLNLPRPECDYETVVSPPSDDLLEIVDECVARSEKMQHGSFDPKVDNMLKVTNDGRLAALDVRLLRPNAPDQPDSKINTAVKNIFNIWKKTSADRLTQLVFSDLSTPTGKGFNVYDEIRQKLIDQGIPENEIRFIHEAKTDIQKDKLFGAVRRGDVRILIGSTQKMGAGTNVQDKLVALHHLDVPWRPSEDGHTQRYVFYWLQQAAS